MGGDINEQRGRQVYWAGRQWCVSEYGLETNKPERYFVEAERLGELSQGKTLMAERLRHIAEKTWVDVEDLIAAFSVAVLVHAGKFDPLPAEALINTLTDIRARKWRSAEFDRIREERGLTGSGLSHSELHDISTAVEPRFLNRISEGPPFKFIADVG